VPYTQIHPEGDWSAYYRATAARPPSRWFVAAAEVTDINHGDGRTVVDLGCGNGVETKAFLDRGWRVFAFDREQDAIDFTRARVDQSDRERLTARVMRFQDVELPDADMIFAQLSLPFCDPDAFPHLWEEVRTSLVPGGFFVGQFLGPNDDWGDGRCLTHSVSDVEALLDEWAILDISEEQHDGVAGAEREPKFWHIISVIARKP
jgi:tellurite methyltransferase